jgi:hypothetical protein
MFTVQVIEVLGTPLDTDVYVRNFVARNCIKITRDVENLESLTDVFIHFEPLTDVFIHFHLIQKTMNIRVQYMSVNITLSSQEQFLSVQYVHVDMVILNVILKKGTRGSFQLWDKDDHDLVVTILQKPRALGGFGLTPNVTTQKSVKDTMTPRLLGLVGSLPLEEQQL